AALLEGAQDIAHGLRRTADGLGNLGGSLAAGTSQQDLAAADGEGLRGVQSRVQAGSLLVGQSSNEMGSHPSMMPEISYPNNLFGDCIRAVAEHHQGAPETTDHGLDIVPALCSA